MRYKAAGENWTTIQSYMEKTKWLCTMGSWLQVQNIFEKKEMKLFYRIKYMLWQWLIQNTELTEKAVVQINNFFIYVKNF